MAAPNEVKIVFTADLQPFTDGLKMMLSMTSAAGKQITPLLNMQAKVDTSVLDQQLQQINQSTEEYIRKIGEAASTTASFGQGEEDAGKKVTGAEQALERKNVSLLKTKRSALETFGAISFLAQGILKLASDADSGSKRLEKMSQSMSQGISAGFGLAGMMGMLGIATGGTAVAIGAVVTIGVALLNFFSDAEEKARNAAKMLELFNESLRGATRRDLEEYRGALLRAILEQGRMIQLLEKQQSNAALREWYHGIVQGIDALLGTEMTAFGAIEGKIDEHKEKRTQLVDALHSLDKQMTSDEMTSAELRKKIRDLEVQSVQDKFQRMQEEENQRYKEELDAIRKSKGTQDEIRQAVELAERAHQRKLTDIFTQEEEERERERKKHEEDRKREQEKELQRRKQILEAGLDATKSRLATEKTVELTILREQEIAAEKSESVLKDSAERRIAIEEAYAIKVIDAEEQAALAIADNEQLSEEQRTAIKAKFAAQREQIRRESGLKFLDAEKQDADAWKEIWVKNNQIVLDAIGAAWDELWRSMNETVAQTTQTEIDQRQVSTELFLIDLDKRKAALQAQLAEGEISQSEYNLRIREMELERQKHQEEDLAFQMRLDEERRSSFERAWMAIEDIAVSALGEILKEEIKSAIISLATTESAEASKTATVTTGTAVRQSSIVAETLTTLASGAASILKAVASAIEWQIAAFGPFALLTIGASIAGIYGLWEGAKATLGFAQGGKTKPGEQGFIEGFKPEIIAPEKDFYEIARAEMIPKMLLMTAATVEQQFQRGVASSGDGRMIDVIERLERVIDAFNEKQFQVSGDSIQTASNVAQTKKSRAGIQ